MLTIITPCCRQKNLSKLYESIQFDKIIKWIIVYDTSKNRKYSKIYDHPKIMEVECDKVGVAGHPQRNFGMTLAEGFLYFLDDDNIIHPRIWPIVDELNPDKFYTFDQQRSKTEILKGNNIKLYKIDTAMYIVHKNCVKENWLEHKYNADGYFICDIYYNNPSAHVYVNAVAAYYNYLS